MEITTFENARTTITEIPITNAGFNFTVTANAEQIPNTNTVTGFPLLIGPEINLKFFRENKGSLSFLLITIPYLLMVLK